MRKLSFRMAFGGIAAALCIIIMLLAAIIPFATYACPMIAGFIIYIVSLECGRNTAIASYISVAALLMILSPEKESALLFATFFGYYPMLSIYTDRIRSRIVRWTIRLLVFNVTCVISYLILMKIFVAVSSEEFTVYSTAFLLLSGNALIVVFDKAVHVLSDYYQNRLRKKLFRRK